MDRIIKMLAPAARIRFATVDVTRTAKTLEARHLSGPTAGQALAQGLAATALLAADSARPDEATLLQVRVDGPLGGLTIEATGAGDLRGYTAAKVLNELDGSTPVDARAAFGTGGNAQVARTRPGKLLNRTALLFRPPDMTVLMARYFNQSLQTPAAVCLTALSDAGGVILARGCVAERMPDGSQAAFVPVLEAFDDGRVRARLEHGAEIPDWAALFGLPDLAVGETRELRFGCRCSRERALASFGALAQSEIDEMVQAGVARHVVCHLCGADYLFTAEEIAR